MDQSGKSGFRSQQYEFENHLNPKPQRCERCAIFPMRNPSPIPDYATGPINHEKIKK